jgi:hypothetical protein
MRPTVLVTPERVFDAANRLKDQGVPTIEITNTRIRRELGGGSMEDIQPLLREWKLLKQNTHEIEAPEELKQEINKFGQSIWKIASSMAMEQATKKFEDYHVLHRERDELYREVSAQEQEIGQLNNTLTQLYKELMMLKENVVGYSKELGVYKAKQDFNGHVQVTEEKLFSLNQNISEVIDRCYNLSKIETKSRPIKSPDDAN